MKSIIFIFAVVLCVHSAAAQSTLVAVDDLYNVFTDSTLAVPGPGFLGNDQIAMGDSVEITIVTMPTNGSLAFAQDGGFIYQPNTGFSGDDTFSYQLESKTLPLQELTVDNTSSSITLAMNAIVGSPSADTVMARLEGTAQLSLSPLETASASAQITALDLTVIDTLSLFLDFGDGFASISAEADPNTFTLNLSEPGQAAEVVNGLFEQADNVFDFNGDVAVSGGGFFVILPDTMLAFDVADTVSVSNEITLMGDMLTLESSVSIVDEFTIELGEGLADAQVMLEIDGTVRATGTVSQPAQSNVATVSITVEEHTTTSVEESIPHEFELSQNYPNPFNPTTSIAYALPVSGPVTLTVYDLLGREVQILVDGQQAAGRHDVLFEASGLPSGMYLYRLETSGYSETKTLVLLK